MEFVMKFIYLMKPTLQLGLVLLESLEGFFKHLFSVISSWNWNGRKNQEQGIKNIPGPLSLPFIGALWLYSRIGPYSRKKYHFSNHDKYQRYGPVVREEGFMNFPLIHLFHRDDIVAIVKHRSDLPLRPHNPADVYYRKTRPDIYNNIGMVNENGEKWKELRNQLTPPLTKAPQNHAPQICQIIDDFIDVLETQAIQFNRQIHGFKHQIYRATLEMVCTVSLDRRLGFMDPEIKMDVASIMESLKGYQTASCEATYGVPWWQYLPKNFSSVFTHMVKYKDNLLDRIGSFVDDTINFEVATGNYYSESKSIIGQLLADKSLDIKDIKASVVDYILAGVDTIGNSIIFTIALIAMHPRAQRRLQEEVDKHLSSRDELTLASFQTMKFLKACVMESFRIYPTADQIARITETKMVVQGGYEIPAGSIIFCHHRLAALQEENFTRATEFIPERWIDEECDPTWKRDPNLVLPFGFGKRACPGKRLAEVKLYITVAKMFHAFEITLDDEIQTEFNFLLVPAGPMRMSLFKRSPVRSPGN